VDPDSHDDELLAELAAALGPRLEPPPDVLNASREIFTWRTVDEELAALTFDSLVESGGTTRSGDGSRFLVFEGVGRRMEAEIDVSNRIRRLIGQFTPAGVDTVRVLTRAGESIASVDEWGRFTMPLPTLSERVLLRWTTEDGRTSVAQVRI
jgi:hypothetical protein